MEHIGEALDALRAAGVTAPLRKPLAEPHGRDGSGPEPVEVDIRLAPRDVRTADAVLRGFGFHRLRAPAHADHRFWVTWDGLSWLKLDAKLEGRAAPSRLRRGLARRRPVALRRMGPVVAVVGPDGAGKTTVLEGLRAAVPVALSTVYLGSGRSGGAGARPQRAARRRRPRLPETVNVVRLLLRRAATLASVYAVAWSGRIVVTDRHPLEALAVDPRRSRAARAVERFVVGRVFPWPDAVIVLDAPAEVLHARKREHDIELLRRWRERYAAELGPRGAVTVPTTGPTDAAVTAVAGVVWDALRNRRRW